MANTIQIKRSPNNNAPTSLEKGELAWVDHSNAQGGSTGTLYIGDMTGAGAVVRTIGGTADSGYVSDILNDTALTGTPTAPTPNAVGAGGTEVATVDYVNSAITAGGGSLVALSDTNIAAAADAHVLVYDASNGWQNKEMTGHVSIDKTGATAVVDLPGGLVTDAMMHANMNYVSTITAGDNISFTGGSSGSGKASTPTIALSDDVTIAGNLVVNGTTSTVDSTTVSIADPIFKLGSGADAAVAACDRGIEIGYVDSGSAKLGFFGMDMTDSKFKFITNGTNTGDQFSGDAGNVLFGDIEGTIKTVAQNHIESATSLTAVGDITLGTWNGTAISSGRGGTGIDSSSASGVASVTGGTWSIDSNLSVAYGGTGAGTFTAKGIMYGNDAGALQVTAAGAEGNMLRAGTGGTPEWTNTLDGGEF